VADGAKAYLDLRFSHFLLISGMLHRDYLKALTANNAGIINKLVMVFALPLHLDKFLIALASGHAHLLAI
jgi:hypothetical protein